MLNGSPTIADKLVAFVLVAGLFAIWWLVFPETIPAGGGFGFDGIMYAEMVMRLDEMIEQGELPVYYAQRVLPSLIVQQTILLTGQPLEAESIIKTFRLFNVVLLMLSLFVWFAVVRALGLSRLGFWAGFVGLFLCFGNAKHAYYYPVFTDSFAFLLGSLMVLALVKRSALGIAAVALVGAFAWQMSVVLGALLILSLLVTNGQGAKGIALTAWFQPSARFRKVVYGLVFAGAGTAGLALFAANMAGVDLGMLVRGKSFVINPFTRLLTNLPMLLLVALAVLSMAFAFWASRPRLDASKMAVFMHVALAAAVLVLPRFVIDDIANPALPAPGMVSLLHVLRGMMVSMVTDGMVLLPMVAHIVYYGPLFLLLVLLWPAAARAANDLGAGFVGVLLIFIVFSIFSESRYTFMLWPFIGVLMAVTLEKVTLSKPVMIASLLIAGYLSKAWFQINQGPWSEPGALGIREWPKSLYFAHHGPWVNWEFYVQQGIVTASFTLIMAYLLRSEIRRAYAQPITG